MTTSPPASKGERAPRADAVRNRQAIVQAARKVMAKRGLEVGMDDVARAAKVGVGTVYRHFPTKDDLIAALAEYRFERLAQYARDALAEEDAGAAFERFMLRGAELQHSDLALAQVMVDRGELMGAAAERVGMEELVSEVVERAKQAGVVRDDLDPLDVPLMMCGLGAVTSGKPAPFRGPTAWQRYMGIVLDGMRPGGRSELPPRD